MINFPCDEPKITFIKPIIILFDYSINDYLCLVSNQHLINDRDRIAQGLILSQ